MIYIQIATHCYVRLPVLLVFRGSDRRLEEREREREGERGGMLEEGRRREGGQEEVRKEKEG